MTGTSYCTQRPIPIATITADSGGFRRHDVPFEIFRQGFSEPSERQATQRCAKSIPAKTRESRFGAPALSLRVSPTIYLSYKSVAVICALAFQANAPTVAEYLSIAISRWLSERHSVVCWNGCCGISTYTIKYKALATCLHCRLPFAIVLVVPAWASNQSFPLG